MLMLQDVGRGDEGFYMCVAGNTLGETTSLATLEIAGAAAPYQQPSHCNVAMLQGRPGWGNTGRGHCYF